MPTKKCMAPTCTKQVDEGRLTCRDCWSALPQTVQQRVCERLYGWKDFGAAREFLSRWYQEQKAQAMRESLDGGKDAA